MLCSESSGFSKTLEFVPSCWIAQIRAECRSRIRRPRVGLPRSRQSAGRECGALVTDCPDPNKVPVTNSGPRVALPRSQQIAGREIGAFLSSCSDPYKVPVANSRPTCRIAQIPNKCRPRIRSHRVGLLRSRRSAGREFGDFVTVCPGPDTVPVANSGSSCRIGQMPKF